MRLESALETVQLRSRPALEDCRAAMAAANAEAVGG
jgi:hypothetical protein